MAQVVGPAQVGSRRLGGWHEHTAAPLLEALDARLGRYVGSMLASDIGKLLQSPAMELGDIVDPAIAAFDARLAAAIAAAMSEKDRRRLGVTPEEIAGALHTVAQGAKYLSNARAESREEFRSPHGRCCPRGLRRLWSHGERNAMTAIQRRCVDGKHSFRRHA
jgi:hypothetical protein